MENTEVYFSNEALARFVAAQGRTVEKIICHLWQNSSNKNDVVEIIDNVELHFADKQKLTIACNVKGDGLDAIDFDAKQTAKDLHEEFEGKIKLFAIDASGTKMWQEVIGKTLKTVRITKDGEYYKADAIILDFENNEMREISIAPLDGLIIDYYEEV
ncbi:MAG: hypothetical protein KF900_09210 [Bacteroidetes bacterium]|nr:hypothetical protein [Bacteroidota bacterium]